jgi:hypothetical protein
MSKVKEAIDHSINRLARAQQESAAFTQITNRFYYRGNPPDNVQEAITVISDYLRKNVIDAWENLSWLAPISREAMELLRMRTKTWFERDNTSIMDFLGYSGSYYVKDREDFQREVLKILEGET